MQQVTAERIADYKRVCELIGSIFYHGKFKAETPNEKDLEKLLRKLGYFFESDDQMMRKLHPELYKHELKTMPKKEHPDTIRLRKLASLMQRQWGCREKAGYVFAQLDPIVSTREELLLEDFRKAIDTKRNQSDDTTGN